MFFWENIHLFLFFSEKLLYIEKLNHFLGNESLIVRKTNKSIAKRFKVTASGKILRRTSGFRHFLRNKTVKQRRSARQDQPVSPGFSRRIRKAIAAGL
jgi:large subunit ribosomal protein L35